MEVGLGGDAGQIGEGGEQLLLVPVRGGVASAEEAHDLHLRALHKSRGEIVASTQGVPSRMEEQRRRTEVRDTFVTFMIYACMKRHCEADRNRTMARSEGTPFTSERRRTQTRARQLIEYRFKNDQKE